MQRILVHIPARGGSKGVPGKNLRTVLGISLVGWAVIAARRLRRLTTGRASARILVDTDDERIAEEGRAWGAETPFRRPAELARDDAPTAPAVVHALTRYREAGWAAETVVLLQPTSPLRLAEDVAACLEPVLGGAVRSAVSVAPLAHPIELAYRVGPDGTLTPAAGGAAAAVRRQDGTSAVFPSGAVYVIEAGLLESSGRLLHEGATRAVVLPGRCSIDIDTEADLALAEALARGEAASGDGAAPGAPDVPPAAWAEQTLESLRSGGLLRALDDAAGTPGLLASAPRGFPATAVFDGVAACRRAAGLPVAWRVDAAAPAHAAAALSAGASALVVAAGDRDTLSAMERLAAGWPSRPVLTV